GAVGAAGTPHREGEPPRGSRREGIAAAKVAREQVVEEALLRARLGTRGALIVELHRRDGEGLGEGSGGAENERGARQEHGPHTPGPPSTSVARAPHLHADCTKVRDAEFGVNDHDY